MPAKIPSYGLHKPSGQARVYLNGRHVYLGPHGSPGSREKYARLIAEHLAGPSVATSSPATVAGAILRYPRRRLSSLTTRSSRVPTRPPGRASTPCCSPTSISQRGTTPETGSQRRN